jgi:hypothetical protein
VVKNIKVWLNILGRDQVYLFFYLNIMNNIFGDLVEIKTGRNDLIMKAVYISDSTAT